MGWGSVVTKMIPLEGMLVTNFDASLSCESKWTSQANQAVFEGREIREIVFSWLCEAMQGHTIMLLAAALLGAFVWLSALHPDFWHHQGQQTCSDDGNSG